MKKGYFVLLLSTIFLIGCNKKNGSNLDDSLNPSINQTGSSSQVSVKFDEWHESSSWDNKLLEAIGVITGQEKRTLVPSVKADNYKYLLTYDNEYEFNILYVDCYGVNIEKVIEEYEDILVQNHYSLGEEPYGWIELNVTTDLAVQYAITQDKNNIQCLELTIYAAETRTIEWPSQLISLVTSEEVPMVSSKSYEPGITFSGVTYEPLVIIYCYHPSISLDQYKTTLTQKGYQISTSMYIPEASTTLGTHIMMNYYEDEDMMQLIISNDWPYLDIMAILGEDLPRLNNASESKFSYTFVPTGEETSTLTLYYDGVEKTSLETYASQLSSLGYTQDGQESENTYNQGQENKLTITSRNYIKNEGKEDEHYISLLYCQEQKSLAIAILS